MFELFDAYRKENTQSAHDYCDVDFLLRFWRENKGQYLMPLFGDKLILEREVEYQKSMDELRSDMYDLLRDQYSFRRAFIRLMNEHIVNEQSDDRDIVLNAIEESLDNSANMVDNTLTLGCRRVMNERRGWYDYEDIKSFTFEFDNGRKVQVQQGMKITRAMTQLCKQIGLEQDWEKFRIRHSQVLNQKKLKGTLCLSIHPLDYATASDNENGWSSCMSWRENGCYRMGTVEMMNSPMVVCAYLKSEKAHMTICEADDWNSKKWRAWIIVNKDVILCNRHYPYHQENFAIQCIDWMKELVGAAYGWKYEETHTDFYQYRRDTERCVDFYTNYMYNDLGDDDIIGCFREGSKMINLPGFINISGPAECMVCGEEIPYEVQSADSLMCRECDGHKICACCDTEMDEDCAYEGPDGNFYCEECYNERFCECENCGSVEDRDDIVDVVFPISKEVVDQWVQKHGKKDEDGCYYIPSGDPGYSLWRYLRWGRDQTDEVHMCSTCAEQKSITYMMLPYGEEIRVPDPSRHTMESAFSICRPESWHWANILNDVAWADEDDKASGELVKEFWKAQWDAFQKAFFNKGEDTAE